MDCSRVEQAVIADLKNVVKTLSEALSQLETMSKVYKYYIEHLQIVLGTEKLQKKQKEIKKRLSRDWVEANFYKLLPICSLFCSTAFSPSSRYQFFSGGDISIGESFIRGQDNKKNVTYCQCTDDIIASKSQNISNSIITMIQEPSQK